MFFYKNFFTSPLKNVITNNSSVIHKVSFGLELTSYKNAISFTTFAKLTFENVNVGS
jgi:hypothetical protein